MNLYMTGEDLVLQDANNFIIVCGFGNFKNGQEVFLKSDNVANHKISKDGKNSIVTHNFKEVFKMTNNLIVKNDMKIGKIKDFPKTVQKIAHIKDTTIYCIIKMILPDDTTFIRSYSAKKLEWTFIH